LDDCTALLLNLWRVVIGVLLLGFRSVPVAGIARVIAGESLNAGELLLGVVVVFGLRAIALRLLTSVASASAAY
jgi:hypothetical protein